VKEELEVTKGVIIIRISK